MRDEARDERCEQQCAPCLPGHVQQRTEIGFLQGQRCNEEHGHADEMCPAEKLGRAEPLQLLHDDETECAEECGGDQHRDALPARADLWIEAEDQYAEE